MMLRRLLLAGCAFYALTLPASALTLAVKQVMGPPGWVQPFNPDLQFDFARGAAWKGTGTGGGAVVPSESLLTVSRASTCMVDDLSGYWIERPVNTLCRSTKGATAWEARTNGIRNNTMVGAVPGTPGTRPTNWIIGSGTGLTIQLVGVGVGGSTGVDYIDYRLSGTTGSTFITFNFDTCASIAATNAQAWTNSNFISIAAGNIANISSISSVINMCDSGGAFLGQLPGTDFKSSLSNILTRNSTTGTTNNASAAFVQPVFVITYSLGVAVDITIRIGWPQLELGSFATSPIKTTGAAATRAADVVTVPSLPYPSSGDSDVYTLFGSGIPFAPNAFSSIQTLLAISDGTTDNRVRLNRLNASAFTRSQIDRATVAVYAVNGAAWSQGVSGKFAMQVQTPGPLSAFNGTALTAGGAITLPLGLNTLNIGSGLAGVQGWDGLVSTIGLFQHAAPIMDLTR